MSDKKISELDASTTPLAGTETLPVVQSGATKKVTVADLTAGRAVSAAELTLSTGNLIIGTSGKGIDFSGTGAAAEILDDYEEGTWTVEFYDATSGGNVSPSTTTGNYTKVGNVVTASFETIVVDTTGMTATNSIFITLPFAGTSASRTFYGSMTSSPSTYRLAGRTYSLWKIIPAQARSSIAVTGGNSVVDSTMRVQDITSGTTRIGATITYTLT